MSNGLATSEVLALAVDPRNRQVVYAGTRGGEIFRSGNGGRRWKAAGVGLYDVFAFAVDPGEADDGVRGYGCRRLHDHRQRPALECDEQPGRRRTCHRPAESGDGLRRQRPQRTWNRQDHGPLPELAHDVERPAAVPVRVGPGHRPAEHANRLRGAPTAASTRPWTAARPGERCEVGFSPPGYGRSPSTRRHRRPSTRPRSKVIKSTDGGENWRVMSSGLTEDAWKLAIDPQDPQVVYAGTLDNGVFTSHERRPELAPVQRGRPPDSGGRVSHYERGRQGLVRRYGRRRRLRLHDPLAALGASLRDILRPTRTT